MSFGLVQSSFLLGLLGLAIPLIIHLIFRQKPRRVDFGTVRFLREIIERHRGRRKIMRWLLLALRMACLALLALMFARPFLTERSRSGGDRFAAILIDQSASMQLRNGSQRLVDEAIDRAREIIRSSDENTQFEVALFDDGVKPLLPSTEERLGQDQSERRIETLLRELVASPTSFSATNYGPALDWARDLCAKARARSKDVHVFTDLQQSGMDWSEVRPMPADVRVHVHDLGRDLPNNVAVIDARPSRLLARPGDETSVTVSLLNAGPFTLDEVPLVLSLQNGNRPINQRQKVQLEPGAILDVQFELPQLASGLWQGKVALEVVDDLTFDNQRHLAMMVAPQYRVLILDGDPHASPYLCETYFLESALRLAPTGTTYEDSPYNPEVIAWPWNMPQLSDYDQVILANVGAVTTDDANQLGRFVRGGGSLTVFTGDKAIGGDDALVQAGITPGIIVGPRRSDDLPWRIGRWDESHSIFEPFNDPQHGDLRRLSFRGYTAIEPAGDTHVLAEFQGGIPLIVERTLGDGRLLWFLSSCDQTWGDWTRSRLFLPLVHQMLGYLTGLNEGGPIRESFVDSSSPEPRHRTPGVFEQDNHWQVVNSNPHESETDRSTLEDFIKRFELSMGESETVTHQASMARTALELRQNEIWHWFAFVIIGLLCLEFFVANRATA